MGKACVFLLSDAVLAVVSVAFKQVGWVPICEKLSNYNSQEPLPLPFFWKTPPRSSAYKTGTRIYCQRDVLVPTVPHVFPEEFAREVVVRMWFFKTATQQPATFCGSSHSGSSPNVKDTPPTSKPCWTKRTTTRVFFAVVLLIIIFKRRRSEKKQVFFYNKKKLEQITRAERRRNEPSHVGFFFFLTEERDWGSYWKKKNKLDAGKIGVFLLLHWKLLCSDFSTNNNSERRKNWCRGKHCFFFF